MKRGVRTGIALSLLFLGISGQGLSFGESLFRATASYSDDSHFTPRSLFTVPRPTQIGDVVTVTVDETTVQNIQLQLQINKSHTMEENGSTLFNNAYRFYAGKIPFVRGDKLHDIVPSFNGLNDDNQLQTQVQSTKSVRFKDTIACQVVQILPNGYLLIQGKKSVMFGKERSDLFVTGMVNPYYVDKNNTISSRQVGNMQFLMSGKGTISRQQNDGIASKLYQFFN